MHRLIALTFLLVCILLTACSPSVILLTREPKPTLTSAPTLVPPTAAPTPKPTPVPGTKLGVGPDTLRGVTVSLWHGLDGESGALLAQMANEFSQTNSWGILMDVLSQKNQSLLVQAVETALPSPEHPDIVLAFPEHAQAWDQVADLTPYVANPDYGFSSAEIADVPSAFWKQGQVAHRTSTSSVQRQLSVPAVRTARFLFYNVSFAKDLGFTAPPASADDFRKQACAANASWKTDKDQTNDGYGGWVLDNPVSDSDAPWTAYAWLRALGGEVYAGEQYNFSTPENQSALAFLAQVRSDGCAWLSSAPSNYEALTNHKALFAAGSLQNLRSQRAAFAGSPDQWTVIAFPGAAPAIVAYGPDYIVLKSSETRQLAAWLFIRWMLSPENQARWVRGTGLFPMRNSTVALLDNIRNANPQWTAAMDLLPQARTYPQDVTWPKARLVLGDGFFQLFQLNPTANDVTRTLKEMDTTLQSLLP
jgi:ABC-type glycerol-3-phosphate transport system substrate-binding protein